MEPSFEQKNNTKKINWNVSEKMRFARGLATIGCLGGLTVTLALADAEQGRRFRSDVILRMPPQGPLVFCHGFAGVVDTSRYFRGVMAGLSEQGALAVVPTQVAPFASVEQRAQSLKEQIELYCVEWERRYGRPCRVNIIAHSMGGLDIRYAVSNLGLAPLVQSITTVSTPHRGALLADLANGILGSLIQSIQRRFGLNLGALSNLTPAFCEEFNKTCLDDPSVAYYSVAGNVRVPPYNPLFLVQQVVTSLGPNKENDGVVDVESAKWGEFLGVVDLDHLEQCIVGGDQALSLYIGIVNELAQRGH